MDTIFPYPRIGFAAAGESRLQGIGGLINFTAFKAGKGINPMKLTPAGVTKAI